jgi:hypothetical protein
MGRCKGKEWGGERRVYVSARGRWRRGGQAESICYTAYIFLAFILLRRTSPNPGRRKKKEKVREKGDRKGRGKGERRPPFVGQRRK